MPTKSEPHKHALYQGQGGLPHMARRNQGMTPDLHHTTLLGHPLMITLRKQLIKWPCFTPNLCPSLSSDWGWWWYQNISQSVTETNKQNLKANLDIPFRGMYTSRAKTMKKSLVDSIGIPQFLACTTLQSMPNLPFQAVSSSDLSQNGVCLSSHFLLLLSQNHNIQFLSSTAFCESSYYHGKMLLFQLLFSKCLQSHSCCFLLLFHSSGLVYDEGYHHVDESD